MIVKLAVEGKLRDRSVYAFVEEYKKRLSRYFQLEIVEGKYIEKANKNSNSEIFIALDVAGRKFTSHEFAKWFEEKYISSKNITFVIGDASGLSSTACDISNEFISLSDLTFSYKLSLMVLSEQIYRAVTIMTGHPYHK